MKKLIGALLIGCMTLALTACGGKEQTVTYEMETTESGIVITDNMKLDAKGDKITKLTETMTIDMTSCTADQIEQLNVAWDSMVEQYNSVEGAGATGSETDGVYILVAEISAEGETISQLSELGLLTVEGSSNALSLKNTGSALEAGGYTKVE